MENPNHKLELSFRPLTEGLGFHPFSDGLPYAPIGKSQAAPLPPGPSPRPAPQPSASSLAMGAGAVAAGQPRLARVAQRISVPVTPAAPVQPAPPTVAPVAPALEESRYGIGYLFKRMIAYVFDSCLNLGLLIGALSGTLLRQKLSPDLLFNPGVILITMMFLVFFNWALITAQEVTFGTSVGKRLFGLQLRGSLAGIFLRAFFFMPSLGFCGLGLVWALVDRRRRCWHDLVVDFQPVEIARL